jgi:hypothetical protein
MRTVFCAVQLIPFFVLSVLANDPVHATDLPVQGGPGGSYFRSDCSGDYVVGIYVRSGAWIDAIGLKCGTFKAAQGTFRQPPWNRPYHGGGGGGPQERVCPPNSYVAQINFGYTREGDAPKYIDFVSLECRSVRRNILTSVECLHTGEGCWVFHPDPGSNLRRFAQACPDGEAARGIHGRSGAFLDALGLICGRKPVMIAVPLRPN